MCLATSIRRPTTIAGVLLFLSARFFPLVTATVANLQPVVTSPPFHSRVRSDRSCLSSPCPRFVLYILLLHSASSSSLVLLVPLIRWSLSSFNLSNCLNIFTLLIALFLWCLNSSVKFLRPLLLLAIHAICYFSFLDFSSFLSYVHSCILTFSVFVSIFLYY